MTTNESHLEDEGDAINFPTDLFVGRRHDLRRVRRLLVKGDSRLISIIGPAGVGKTRLAIEVARDAGEWFCGGVTIVRLAAVQRSSDIVPEIARALGIVDQAEHLEVMVREELGRQPGIVLLDNLEHLLPAARSTIDWLHGQCPNASVLVTSRHPVDATHEVRIELQPFATEAGLSDESAVEQDTVKLFINRASRRNPRFRLRPGDAAIVSELCNRFDGLPLAIELLAGWADVQTPAEMMQRSFSQLDRRSVTDDPRHQSLLEAIAWSYNLLKPEEQALLRRLSVFTGGFSRDFVEKMVRGREAGVGYPWGDGYGLKWTNDIHETRLPPFRPDPCQDPRVAEALLPIVIDPVRALANLLDHHLINQAEDVDGVLCFDMLATIREFGLMELERIGEYGAVRHAHAAIMIAFAEASAHFMWTSSGRLWGRKRIDAALPNLRLALSWAKSLENLGAEIMARIAAPLWIYWHTRGLITEGRQWTEAALPLPATPEWLRALELPSLGFLCWIQNDDQRAESFTLEGIAAAGRTGNTWSLGMANLVLALVEYRRVPADVVKMLHHVDEAEGWFQHWHDTRGVGACKLIYGVVARLTGDFDQALELFEEGHALHVEAGYEWGIATSRYFAGEVVRELAADDRARVPEAIALLHESLELYWEQGDFWGAGGAMSGLACILAQQNEDVQASTYFGAAAVLMRRVGASLLPTELLTHDDTATSLWNRMGESLFDAAYQQGSGSPEACVIQAISALGPDNRETRRQAPVRLTSRQLAVVRDLVSDLDPPGVARKRGRSLSATYEMLRRICQRLGVENWDDIRPFAIKHGLVAPPEPKSGQALGNWVTSPENP